MNIMPYSIIFLIGPSNSGKTYFVNNVLLPKLETIRPLVSTEAVNIQVLSSDTIRQEILGHKYDKYDPIMTTVSPMAFDVLQQKLKSVTTFPVNAEYVIIDSTGFNEEFRNDVISVAKDNNYNFVPILFDFKYEDYFDGDLPSNVKKTMVRHIKMLHTTVRQSLRKQNIKTIEKITSRKNMDKIEITIDDSRQLLEKCNFKSEEVIAIGDVHGCYDELINLLNENKIVVKDYKIVDNPYNKHIVLAGDFIDKGPKIFDVLKFIHTNIDSPLFDVLIGNHENRLIKELEGKLEHIDQEWFNTYSILTPEYMQIFTEIFHKSLPFYRNPVCIITHAPAQAKYLGKVDLKSLRNMRYINYDSTEFDSIVHMLNHMKILDADLCGMKYLFGHIACTGSIYKNYMPLDGGCASGGILKSVTISTTGQDYSNIVKSSCPSEGERKPFNVKKVDNLTELDIKSQTRIKFLAKDKVNFLSGTMSPCPQTDTELESVKSALNYYREAGITQVVMQPKYMGSRCNLYLTDNNETSYAISRNGYPIQNRLDLSSVFDYMRTKMSKLYPNAKMIILDGELLPWHALGAGLISNFNSVATNIKSEIKELIDTGFAEKFESLKTYVDNSGIKSDVNIMKKKELISKHGNNMYTLYTAMNAANKFIPLEERNELADIFTEQIKIYGSEGELEYKPFAVLKVIYEDHEEIPLLTDDQARMFIDINGDSCVTMDLNTDIDAMAETVFKKWTEDEKLEGAVIKPVHTGFNTVPYIKVRNPKYLTIVYGYDYLNNEKYAKLLNRKSIKSKMRLAKSEWNTGLKMLQIPYDSISIDNTDYMNLCAKFVVDETSESTVDPRL